MANNKATVSATYAVNGNTVTSNEVDIEFKNVDEYKYTRLVVNGNSEITVGNSTTAYTVTLYTQTYTNGVAVGSAKGESKTNSFSLYSSDESVATISQYRATGIKAGVTTISATYNGTYGSISSEDTDDSKKLTVKDSYKYRIELSTDKGTVKYNETVYLTTTLYTSVNGGAETSSTVVPTSLIKYTGCQNITLTPGDPSTARLTDPSLTSSQGGNSGNVRATYVIDGKTYTSGNVVVIFSDVTERRNVRLVVTGDSSVEVGETTGNYTATLYRQEYVNGVAADKEPTTSPVSIYATFTSSNEGFATMNGSKATGVSPGTTYIGAYLTEDSTWGAITSADEDRQPLTVTKPADVITHELVLSADNPSVKYDGTINLTATYYTLTNGVRDGGVTVTPSLTKTGGSNITLTEGNPSTARLTNPALSVVTNNRATVMAMYNGTTSNAVSIAFTNETTYGYTRLVVTGPSSASVGETTGNYTATLHTQTYVNGAASGNASTSDVSASATFTSSNTAAATISGRTAKAVAAGLTHIGASYSGTYGSITTADDDRQELAIGNVVAHELVLSADNASVKYDGTINLTATYYTLTNGVRDGGVTVTPSSLSKTTGGSNITLTAGNPSTARLTNPALSVVANNKATVTATYNGTTSNAVSIEFTNETTYGYTRLVVIGPSSASVGETTDNYIATLHTQTYVNGAASGNASTSDVSASATFTSSNTAAATMDGRKAKGVAIGETFIGASYSGTYGNITSADGDRQPLTITKPADVITYELVLSADNASVKYDGTINLTATYYTLTNGVRDRGMTVTPSLSKTGGSNITLTEGNPSRARLTNPALTVVANNKATVTATHNGTTSNSVDIEFTNETTYEYSLVLTPATASIGVGSSKTYTVKLTTITKTNGVQSGSTTITLNNNNCSWNSSRPSVASITGAGVVTGVSQGSTVITVRYTPSGSSQISATADLTVMGVGWDDEWDDDGEIEL